jgi:hypothetical protein
MKHSTRIKAETAPEFLSQAYEKKGENSTDVHVFVYREGFFDKVGIHCQARRSQLRQDISLGENQYRGNIITGDNPDSYKAINKLVLEIEDDNTILEQSVPKDKIPQTIENLDRLARFLEKQAESRLEQESDFDGMLREIAKPD